MKLFTWIEEYFSENVDLLELEPKSTVQVLKSEIQVKILIQHILLLKNLFFHDLNALNQ